MNISKRISSLLVVTMLLLILVPACKPEVVKEEVVVTKEVPVEVTRVVEVVVTPTPAPKETTLERAKREGILRVGFANEAPYCYATPDGELAGSDWEIMQTVLEKMGIPKVEAVLTEYGGLIPGLLAGRYDAIVAAMWIKPKRCEQVLFGNPNFCEFDLMAVKAGNPYDIHSYEDVCANPEIRLGLMTGGFETDYARALGCAEEQFVFFPDAPSAIAGLQADRIDAFPTAYAALEEAVKNANDPNIEVTDPFTQPVIDGKSVKGCGAIIVRLEDTDFVEAYNAEMKGLQDSGEILEIYDRWDIDHRALPGPLDTAEILCRE